MSDQRLTHLHTCPDCRCQFVQPFKCTTCGAQKLYDHTVRSQAQTIDALRKLLAECWPYLFDDDGTPISHEDLRVNVRAAAGDHFNG